MQPDGVAVGGTKDFSVDSRAMRSLVPLPRALLAAVLSCLVVLTTACQPFGGPRAVAPTPSADASGRPLGAPDAGAPSDLGDLLERGQAIAEEWQDKPVATQVSVTLDADGGWARARIVYVAPDADRLLQLETAGSGFTEQRPSLGTLQVQPVPGEALEEVPAFPEDAAAPQALVAAPATQECGVTGEPTVLYATGAPFAWDGTAWTRDPAWRATVTGADGGGAQFDTLSEDSGSCLEG